MSTKKTYFISNKSIIDEEHVNIDQTCFVCGDELDDGDIAKKFDLKGVKHKFVLGNNCYNNNLITNYALIGVGLVTLVLTVLFGGVQLFFEILGQFLGAWSQGPTASAQQSNILLFLVAIPFIIGIGLPIFGYRYIQNLNSAFHKRYVELEQATASQDINKIIDLLKKETDWSTDKLAMIEQFLGSKKIVFKNKDFNQKFDRDMKSSESNIFPALKDYFAFMIEQRQKAIAEYRQALEDQEKGNN